jgi:ATP-dependent Zn protease
MREMCSSERQLALHEASHSVAMVVLGMPLERTQITISETEWRGSTKLGASQDRRSGAVVALAGKVGVLEFCSWAHEIEEDDEVARRLTDDIEAACADAERLVREHRAAIEKVAELLIAKRCVEGSAVREIVGR